MAVAGALAYARAGTGEPLVFLHGLGIDRAVWAEVALRLEPGFDTIRLDLRGHGESPPSGDPYEAHDDVAQALDALALERVHVAGLSMGGAVAVDLALAHPSRVRSLALVDSALGGWRWSTPWQEAFRAVRARGRAGGPASGREAWAAHELFASAGDAGRDLLARDPGIRWTEVNRALPLTPPAVERLADVRAPTLIVVGERDLPDFQAIARALAAGIPAARAVTLPGIGHLSPLEAPDLLADILRDFLAPLPA